jgi:membrane-associated PAP2 superfamily phosphatase
VTAARDLWVTITGDLWVAITGNLWAAIIAGLLLLAWDASGLDLRVISAWGSPHGFAWHDQWFARDVLHQGGRLLAGVVLCVWFATLLRNPRWAPPRSASALWFSVTAASLLAVPALKAVSTTSCPSELQMFGGVARYVSHWSFGVSDGGPGHCFPSGHATAGFAFVSLYFLFRRWRPPAAPWVLLAVCGIGLLFGWAQMVRGAHYPSHTLWSAWLCWTLCAIVDAVSRRGELYQPAKVG